MDLSAVRHAREPARPASRSTPWAAITPRRGRARRTRYGPRAPRRRDHPRRRRGPHPGRTGGQGACRQRPDRRRDPVIGMDEHPAAAVRRKRDASIIVVHAPRARRRGRRRRHGRPHRGRHGLGDPQPRPPAGRRPPGPRRPDGHRHGPVRPARHRGQYRLHPATTSPSTPAWARCLPSASSACGRRRWRCSRSARRGARATPRVQQATELLDDRPALHRQRRGPRPRPTTRPTSWSATPSLGNVTIKFFEGLSTFIFRPAARASSGATWRGRIAYALMQARARPDPPGLRLREARRLAAARRQRHGAHHPWPGEAADDRVRDGGGRRGRPGADPAAIADAFRSEPPVETPLPTSCRPTAFRPPTTCRPTWRPHDRAATRRRARRSSRRWSAWRRWACPAYAGSATADRPGGAGSAGGRSGCASWTAPSRCACRSSPGRRSPSVPSPGPSATPSARPRAPPRPRARDRQRRRRRRRRLTRTRP